MSRVSKKEFEVEVLHVSLFSRTADAMMGMCSEALTEDERIELEWSILGMVGQCERIIARAAQEAATIDPDPETPRWKTVEAAGKRVMASSCIRSVCGFLYGFACRDKERLLRGGTTTVLERMDALQAAEKFAVHEDEEAGEPS